MGEGNGWFAEKARYSGSPGDGFPLAQELARKALRGVKREPDDRVRAFFDGEGSSGAAHICPDPTG